MYCVTCTTRCSIVEKHMQKQYMHRCVLLYCVLFSSSLHLFHSFFLVFHLKKKHEEGQCLLHYLQQTNTVLATVTHHVYTYNTYVITSPNMAHRKDFPENEGARATTFKGDILGSWEVSRH